MGTSRFGHCALGAIAAAAMLAGCGGQSRTTSAVPQGSTPGGRAEHGDSRMELRAPGGDLLYVSSPDTNDVYVFSYPGGEEEGTLIGFDDPMGLCSDAEGNVWITNADNERGNGYLVEFAHGGTSPIATLDDSQNAPLACYVDPATGNLAVADEAVTGNPNIAVYPDEGGKPTYYSTLGFVSVVQNIVYDNSSNAYFASFAHHPGWLPKRSSSVSRLHLSPLTHGYYGWDGQYLVILENGTQLIRYRIKGGKGKKVGSLINLASEGGPIWIGGGALVTTNAQAGDIYFYNYPAGGSPTTNTIYDVDDPYGVTVSAAPSR